MKELEIKESDLVINQANLIVEENDSMIPLVITEDDKLTKNDIEINAWQDSKSFLTYLGKALGATPNYTDGSANSLKRTIAYYDSLLSEIEETVEKDVTFVDFNNDQLKELDRIDNVIVEARNKLVYKLENVGGNIKRQQLINQKLSKQAKSSQLTWVVDPFLKAIATICINAKVQGGKDIEDVYQDLKKQYSMDKREDLAILQILKDSGYPIRHSMMDGSEDMYTQYYA